MAKKIILVEITIIFMAFFTSLISCDLDGGPSVKSLPDSRFNGDFSRLISSPSGAFHGLDSYTFNGTNKVSEYYKNWSDSSPTWFTLEWDIQYNGSTYAGTQENPGKYRYRLWDNKYSEYKEWLNYYFSTDGSKLYLQIISSSNNYWVYD